MSRPTFMTIDLQALQANFARVRALAPHCLVIAMVKANAYGHGIVRVAQALTDADAFGVASLEEGVILREAGIKQPIILMEGLFSADELVEVVQYRFSLVVHHLPHVEILEQANIKQPIAIWLKLNTGMNRLGFNSEAFPAIYQRLLKAEVVAKPIGLMTHFAQADCLHSLETQNQLNYFKQITSGMSGPRSLANSAGIIAWPLTHADWVRPGLMLYGASPIQGQTGKDHGLQPVMTLSSRLIAISEIKKGAVVGYGGTWMAPEDMKVGVVGVGYGDGYPQFAKTGTPLLVNQTRCELIGRVSMDMLSVDLRSQPAAKIGDPVILWGNNLPVEEVAQHNHTSAYEILTRMTPRPKVEIKKAWGGEMDAAHQVV